MQVRNQSHQAVPRPPMASTIKSIANLSVISDDFRRQDTREHLEFDDFSPSLYAKYQLDTKSDVLQYLYEKEANIDELEEIIGAEERFFTSAQLVRFINGEHRSTDTSEGSKVTYSNYYIKKAIKALGINTGKYRDFDYSYAVTISEAYKIKDYIDDMIGKKAAKSRLPKLKKLPALICAIANQKGGASKTTTTHSLATGIAVLYPESKVLMIDSDHQCTLTDYYSADIIELMGWSEDSYIAEQDISLGDILITADPVKAKEMARKAIRKTSLPNLDVLPGRRRDNSVNNEVYKKNDVTGEGELLIDDYNLLLRMEKTLSQFVYEYDYIFIDMSPQVTNLISYNSLAFCHQIIVPLACTRNDVQATTEWISELTGQVRLLDSYGAYGFIDDPILLRANYEKQKSQESIEAALMGKFGKYMMSSKHMHSEAIASANLWRKSIFEVSEAQIKDKAAYKRAIDNTLDVVEEAKALLDNSRNMLLEYVEKQQESVEV